MRLSYYFDGMPQVAEVTHVSRDCTVLIVHTVNTSALYINCDDDKAAAAIMRDISQFGYAEAPASMQVSTSRSTFQIVPAPVLGDYIGWFKKLPDYFIRDLYTEAPRLVYTFIMMDRSEFENFSKTYLDFLCVNHPARDSLTKTKKSTVRKLIKIHTKAPEVLEDLRKYRKSVHQYLISGDVDYLCQLLTESEAEGLLLILKGDSNG